MTTKDVVFVTAEEFASVYKPPHHRSVEGDAMRALEVGQAISMPCRWNHTPNCAGGTMASYIGHKRKWKLLRACKNKRLYVMRVE